jgi:hypothetical protein
MPGGSTVRKLTRSPSASCCLATTPPAELLYHPLPPTGPTLIAVSTLWTPWIFPQLNARKWYQFLNARKWYQFLNDVGNQIHNSPQLCASPLLDYDSFHATSNVTTSINQHFYKSVLHSQKNFLFANCFERLLACNQRSITSHCSIICNNQYVCNCAPCSTSCVQCVSRVRNTLLPKYVGKNLCTEYITLKLQFLAIYCVYTTTCTLRCRP